MGSFWAEIGQISRAVGRYALGMEVSELLQTIETLHADARSRGLFFQHCTDDRLVGRSVRIDGAPLLSFGSCSYLGLEYHPDLVAAVHDAVDRYGTQFASSRGYLSAPQYEEFEDCLSRIFGAHAICLQTTTLAHQAAFDVFLTEKDAIVMDHQVHYSVQRAAVLARSAGARVELVRHEELERAIDVVKALAQKHRTVWFAADGVTSMYGELVNVDLLRAILDVAPNVRLYIDDAHGMSWAGEHGRGSFLSRMALDDRIVVATSLAKAFAAGGAALVFSDAMECERVRMCGGPMVFSGPLQPPLLGAALASARLHLTDEIVERQAVLQDRIAYCNERMAAAHLPLLVANETPVVFVRLGLPRVATAVAQRLAADGVYVNVSMYPSVPMKRGGLRLGITTTHSHEDIDRVVESLQRHVPRVLEEEGLSLADLDALFERSVVNYTPTDRDSAKSYIARLHEAAKTRTSGAAPRNWAGAGLDCDPSLMSVQHAHSVEEIDRAEWDGALGAVGCISWEAMRAAERIFRDQPHKEHNWEFHYVVVRDADRRPVCMTCFTVLLQKDDALMRDGVSRAVEQKRLEDPYFLTSKAVVMGSGLSEGNHLYLDRNGPWRAAMHWVLQTASKICDEAEADLLVLRDLPGDDVEMDAFLLLQGLVKIPNLDSHRVELDWDGPEEFLRGLTKKRRQQLRPIIALEPSYRVHVYQATDGSSRALGGDELEYLHGLYRAVARKKLRFNTFELPENLLEGLLRSPAWEVGTLRLDPSAGGPAHGRPVAFWAAHKHGQDYAPLFCGLDYGYVAEHGAYRHMIYRFLLRAKSLGMRVVHLGMDAELEKRRFGAAMDKTCLYAQTRTDFNGALLREVVAEVGMGPSEEVTAP
ncbi:MAG: aminotransferase class I/II-fold pyridoxal phosphate-dependent enzyme [Deltaproteobacteria bacterium]|nr:aminotransferase class I/II-fold pyridoxal phosphate-dependent enzyme [Deltaproteobacteria bacterium]